MTITPIAPVNLDTKRWKKRLLIVFAPPEAAAAAKRHARLWEDEDAGLQERDLEIVTFEKTEEQPEIARRFHLTNGNFAVLLVGKDGTEKLRSREPIAPKRLYAEIDSMPLRQEEMKRR